MHLHEPTRREQRREQTFAEIVTTSRALIGEGEDLSLRAVAARMGVTAPALYRYVASYQELVDLVAFEVDRLATEGFAAAADALPADDLAGRLVVGVCAFRRWALSAPREFGMVFANPVAESPCTRRELLTLASSGIFFTDLIRLLWERERFALPRLEDLPDTVRAAVLDPLIPAKVDDIAAEDRGLVWIMMQGWSRLYGVVALEVFGHLDPRVVESGEMFVDVMTSALPLLGLDHEQERLDALMRAELARS
ncbi:TetR/AcrR family transcriptional regulator [Nocardioides acrostichi]|uniref:WHG domain-containing protein n=1 Tax=Nocardioides acrostichi TaxID=2784339 RepID=A0A930Y8U9_9ACTN|nr:TetR/AcrR family transcriptional regulator [Nocardioides acrostichi]MBF4163492.1 WHG domain-containing protein [Nocardioides acrostichi]